MEELQIVTSFDSNWKTGKQRHWKCYSYKSWIQTCSMV